MKRTICFYIAFVSIASLIIYGVAYCFSFDIYKLYYSSVRSIAFSAFLTMGGFMLSLLGIFMFSLKDKLFDSDGYKNIYEQSRNEANKHISIYQPLVNIAKIFIFCIFCCFINSFVHLIVGLAPFNEVGAFCISLAMVTILLAIYVLYLVWSSLTSWFDILTD